jgi:hypothetical protein
LLTQTPLHENSSLCRALAGRWQMIRASPCQVESQLSFRIRVKKGRPSNDAGSPQTVLCKPSDDHLAVILLLNQSRPKSAMPLAVPAKLGDTGISSDRIKLKGALSSKSPDLII